MAAPVPLAVNHVTGLHPASQLLHHKHDWEQMLGTRDRMAEEEGEDGSACLKGGLKATKPPF